LERWIEWTTLKRILSQFNDDRIRIFQDTNHGKSWVLNQAIHFSRGNFIAILDDDDRWMDNKLMQQIYFLLIIRRLMFYFLIFTTAILVTGEKGIGFEQNKKGLDELVSNKVENELFIITNNFPKGLLHSNFICLHLPFPSASFSICRILRRKLKKW